MFDPSQLAVGGVSLIVMVFGLTEFIKDMLNLEGKKVTAMAALLGAIVMGLYSLIGVLPEQYAQVVTAVFSSVVFGLSASGYYKFADARMTKKKGTYVPPAQMPETQPTNRSK